MDPEEEQEFRRSLILNYRISILEAEKYKLFKDELINRADESVLKLIRIEIAAIVAMIDLLKELRKR